MFNHDLIVNGKGYNGMSNIYIINSSKKFVHSEGKLNDALTETAQKTLSDSGHTVRTIRIDNGYDIGQEVQKYLWADAVIYQTPAWWMEGPWILKRYMDKVFTAGAGVLYKNDGRTRSDPSKKYGSGGLLQGRAYMISSTWNAPVEAFEDKSQFFEGRGVDAPFYALHRANMFIGLSPLPSFMCNDVMKRPQFEKDVERLREHLKKVYGRAS